MLPIRSPNDSAVFNRLRKQKPSSWARKTLSHLSIIVVSTPHKEHFPVRLKFTAAGKN
jgi:hypothetical protein